VVEYLTACLAQGDAAGANQYRLDFAYNGEAGIEHALENVPDLIMSDVMMPSKDGFEVLEMLKNDERTSHIPIILLTARADVQSRLSGLRRGADAYLSKPFHQEELLVTVENLLELRRKLQAKYSQWEAVPGDPAAAPGTDPEDAFLQKLRSVVEANLSDPDFEMPQLGRALAMSRSQIYRKVKALTGKSPSLFIRSIRLHHGRHLLQTTDLTVSEIAYEVGYSALNNFSDAFLEEFGERPGKVRG
jgi:CheY-like chemotaxis protein